MSFAHGVTKWWEIDVFQLLTICLIKSVLLIYIFYISIYPYATFISFLNKMHWRSWASYQIRKIAGCACAGNAGNVFPRRRFQRKPLVSDPGMHHGTCVTHVPWCMSGSLTCGDGENVPGIPGACAPAILRIWQEAHLISRNASVISVLWYYKFALVEKIHLVGTKILCCFTNFTRNAPYRKIIVEIMIS